MTVGRVPALLRLFPSPRSELECVMNQDIVVAVGEDLRRRVRRRIEEGRLPNLVVNDLYAGFGRNHVCSACGNAITPQQVEYEFADPRNESLIVLHLHCHTLWQAECGTPSSAAAMGHRKS
jgi:hypothetical protein